MKYFFPIHIDGDNRGCEGIAKGTAVILGLPKEQLVGLCSNVSLDKRLGVDSYVSLKQRGTLNILQRVARKLVSYLNINSAYWYSHKIVYKPFLDEMKKGDIMISTGGDMMCYNDNEVIYTNNLVHNKGFKSILWGCSIGKNNLTPRKLKTLKNFSCIYARESLTYDLLQSIGLQNVILFPDPAFILTPEKCTLPNIFKTGEVIGINLSNYVVGADHLDTPFGKEVIKTIDYVLNETNLNILLVPHVLWNSQDDRLISKTVLKHYNYNKRITILESESLNYLQIRYVISQCKLFVGARTHAIISAYSTCTPAIALGYSVKARGIAKDLGLNEKLVVDSKSYSEGQLLSSLNYSLSNEDNIRQHLNKFIPSYIKDMGSIKEKLNIY